MSRISRFCRTLDQWCNGYGRFVNELRGGSLQFLAIVTVVSGISLFSSSKITSEADDTIYVVYVIGLLYLAVISWYIQYKRTAVPIPPAPVEFPNLRRFILSVNYVACLAFFFTYDEPIKSLRNEYIPWICISAYVHILVVLAIFRLRDDYGFSDGFLAAAYTLLFPMCSTNSFKIYLTLCTFFLFGIRNLQLRTPIEIQIPPIPLHIPQAPVPPVSDTPVDQTEINMSRRGKKSAGRSTIHQPQAYKSNRRHNRHAST